MYYSDHLNGGIYGVAVGTVQLGSVLGDHCCRNRPSNRLIRYLADFHAGDKRVVILSVLEVESNQHQECQSR